MTTGPSPDRAAALLALHTGPGFVLPNAWDAGSARVLEQVGFPAIATTSAGIAWSCGVPDGGALARAAFGRVSRNPSVLGHCRGLQDLRTLARPCRANCRASSKALIGDFTLDALSPIR